MVRTEHVLINKKKPFVFEAGQKFVVKIAKNIVATLKVTDRKTRNGLPILQYQDAYEVKDMHGVSCLFRVCNHLYGKAVYQVVETEVEARPVMIVFDIETHYPNHREALVGKQFITGKVGEVYVARRKVPKPAGEVWEVKTKPSEEIEMLITSTIDGTINVAVADGSYTGFFLNQGTVRNISFFDDFYIFRLLSNEPPVKEPIFGVAKTVFDQTAERYIVWSPGSRQPSQQIFTSARQARYVAYRMTEENKGQVFYWAKLEGHSQWGELPE